MSADEVEQLAAQAPRPNAKALRRLDGRAMSGTESLVRFRLQSLGFRVAPQYCVPGAGVGDLLLGDRDLVECDSRRFHTGEANWEHDRRRDHRFIERGFLVMRMTYAQVINERATMLGAIRARTDARHHGPVKCREGYFPAPLCSMLNIHWMPNLSVNAP